jgi:hypothetical protein
MRHASADDDTFRKGGTMGKRYWGRGSLRLGIALALLLVVPIGIATVIETTQDLRFLAVYVLAVIGIVSLPPLILLLPGLVIAWIARRFARTPHQQAEA